jgi:hypothetical protein
MKEDVVYILAAIAIVGAPLFAYVLRGVVTGRHFLRARWPIVAVYYGLVGLNEAVPHLGGRVAGMILIVLGSLVALILLDATPRRMESSERERRGFPVGPAKGES